MSVAVRVCPDKRRQITNGFAAGNTGTNCYLINSKLTSYPYLVKLDHSAQQGSQTGVQMLGRQAPKT